MNDTVQTTNVSATALGEFDFILVLDASGSMSIPDTKNGKSRWEFMKESVGSFARDLEQIDSDGIDVIVFNGAAIDAYDGVTASKVDEIFAKRSPRSSTPLAEALQKALDIGKKSSKNKVVVVFTDGVPDHPQSVVDLIVKQSNSQEKDEELTFLFIQVGHDDAATKYLAHLDDDLTSAKFDIVDAVTIEEAEKFETTTALILKAIDD